MMVRWRAVPVKSSRQVVGSSPYISRKNCPNSACDALRKIVSISLAYAIVFIAFQSGNTAA